MKTLYGLDALTIPLAESVLTIGNFDGVHRAHQQLLAQAGLFAANTGGPLVVLTFEPHPLSVVAPSKSPPRLSTLDDKLCRLSKAGADLVVVARSEPALLQLEASRFVEEIIMKRFHPTHLVEGPSFGFGRGRQGNPELLQRMASSFACEVHIVKPVTLQIEEGVTRMVSSSLIRQLVTEGLVHRATLCLGRPYRLNGNVVEGESRGHTLGFPTVNLAPAQQLVPQDGVYAGHAVLRNQRYSAAISIGSHATFGTGGERHIEAHLLDFNGNVYGESIALEFDRRLRDQRTFSSADELVEQIRRDIAQVLGYRTRSQTDHPNSMVPTP